MENWRWFPFLLGVLMGVIVTLIAFVVSFFILVFYAIKADKKKEEAFQKELLQKELEGIVEETHEIEKETKELLQRSEDLQRSMLEKILEKIPDDSVFH